MDSLILVIVITVAIIVLIVMGGVVVLYQQMKRTRNTNWTNHPGQAGSRPSRDNRRVEKNGKDAGQEPAQVLSREWRESGLDNLPANDHAVSYPDFKETSTHEGEVIAVSPPAKNGRHHE